MIQTTDKLTDVKPITGPISPDEYQKIVHSTISLSSTRRLPLIINPNGVGISFELNKADDQLISSDHMCGYHVCNMLARQ